MPVAPLFVQIDGRVQKRLREGRFIRNDSTLVVASLDVFFVLLQNALIGVFNAQNELSTRLFGEQVIVESCTHSANVQWASWAGRKTNTNRHGSKIRRQRYLLLGMQGASVPLKQWSIGKKRTEEICQEAFGDSHHKGSASVFVALSVLWIGVAYAGLALNNNTSGRLIVLIISLPH